MLGVPSLGQRVRLWPAPGLKVQNGDRPLDSGGRFMSAKGEVVLWSSFYHEQYNTGAVMLHAPPCAKHEFDSEECRLCGRDRNSAQEYDVHFATGMKAAEDAAGKAEPKQKPSKGKE